MSAPHQSQFALLRERRFAPLFWTQFLSAFNDNAVKIAIVLLTTYQLQLDWLPPAQAGLVIGALFIFPFLLFSATAGQVADKFDKGAVMRTVKDFELAIAGVAAAGFLLGSVPTLLASIFLLGLHSTFFGPVKYAYLPQHLSERELTGGNGLVEMGTFVAILLGNVLGSVLIAVPGLGPMYIAIACGVLAILGRVSAQAIPASPSETPDLRINWNPFSETWRNLKLAREQVAVFRSLLGISWMWFFGAVFLSSFPAFAKDVLHGDAHVATLLLVVFSIGVGAGSLLCEVLSRRHVEIGLVPVGAIGMTVFAIDLYFASRSLPPAAALGVFEFLAQPVHWRVLADLGLIALFAGLFSVPMYALIQLRSKPTHRARVVASLNVLNALFMIASSILAGVLLGAGLSISELFLALGIANAVVATYIFLLVPEYLLRFCAWVLSHCIYRFKVTGDEHIPTKGPAVLICNHVSFVDAILLMGASPRPIRFFMANSIFQVPVLGALFRLAKAIPVTSQKDDPEMYEAAFEKARAVLDDDELVCIFPEGALTRDGSLQPFKGGVMKLLDGRPNELVVPMALHGLWGSFFSRVEQGRAMVRPFRRGAWSKVALTVSAPRRAAEVTAPAVLYNDVAIQLATEASRGAPC